MYIIVQIIPKTTGIPARRYRKGNGYVKTLSKAEIFASTEEAKKEAKEDEVICRVTEECVFPEEIITPKKKKK